MKMSQKKLCRRLSLSLLLSAFWSTLLVCLRKTLIRLRSLLTLFLKSSRFVSLFSLYVLNILIRYVLNFEIMEKKNWLYYVLVVVKYAVTAALGYFGGNAVM